MTPERPQPEQLSFLAPQDAALMQLLRVFVAEASRIYEPHLPRALVESPVSIVTPADLYPLLVPEMAQLSQEQVRTVVLNMKNHILGIHLIYQGSASSALVRAAEVFRPAVVANGTGIIVAHNHPSGDPNPSPDDIRVTRQLVEAGQILDVQVLDHLIIAANGCVSLRERGLGFGP